MSNVSALGFYAKHPLIMDALYDMDEYDSFDDSIENAEGLPVELVVLARANAAILRSLLENIDKELEKFEIIQHKLRASLECGAKIPNFVPGNGWDCLVKAVAKDGRMKHSKKMEFGWTWKIENEILNLYSWTWISGGRVAEEFLLKELRKLAPKMKGTMTASGKIEGRQWASGVVILDRINVSERVGDGYSLDLDKLSVDLWQSFKWINKNKLSELFICSCNIGR